MSHDGSPLSFPEPGWAVYLRTSTDEKQKPEFSLARQRDVIEQNVLSRSELPHYREYVDVLSGKNPNRKEYQRMLADARRGRFSHVIVERADRFGRSDTEALRAIDELDQYKVAVRFANAPELDPMDPDDRVLVALSFSLAQRESTLLGIRVKAGLKAKRLSGGYVGRAPDGYINMRGQTAPEQRSNMGRESFWIEPDPKQAVVWREAWALLLTNRFTIAAIAVRLDEKGYLDRNGKPFVSVSKTGKRKPLVDKLLRAFQDWTYAGWVVSETDRIVPKTIRGNWESLVSTEDFELGLEIIQQLKNLDC